MITVHDGACVINNHFQVLVQMFVQHVHLPRTLHPLHPTPLSSSSPHKCGCCHLSSGQWTHFLYLVCSYSLVKELLWPQRPAMWTRVLQELPPCSGPARFGPVLVLHRAINTTKNLTNPETFLTCYSVWLRQAVKGLIPVTQHAGAVAGGQAGSAEADLWPLRKGMWKLFHPGQKLKTPRRLKSGGPILLSTFLIRGSKQRFHVNVLWSVCHSGICHFGMKFHPAAVCLLLCDHCSDAQVWLGVGNGCSCAVCAGGKPWLWSTVCSDL